jgi:aminotransferase EvaB
MLINDLTVRLKQNHSQISQVIDSVLLSGWIILGPKVKQFETEFANYIGTKHCITLANGTDAIELGLKALGISKGFKVATVANAGMYTTTAVLAIDALPLFMDVNLSTKNTSLLEVKKAVANGANAVVITHLYGLACAEIEQIAQYCKANNVPLLEDCAQAHGAKINGKTVGSFGDVASFSFYPTKNLGALGDGGAIVSNDLKIADTVRQLRQYGWTTKYHVDLAGARNSRLDEIQAALLSLFLPNLDANNEKRRQIAKAYKLGINNSNLVLPNLGNEDDVVHLYIVSSKYRDSLKEHLKSLDIASDVHYPIPDHKQKILKNLFKDHELPITEQLANEILTLPCYPEMTREQVEMVIEGINSWNP